MAYSILMAKQISVPLADGYSALILTNTQLHALRWLLDRDEVKEMLYELDPYVIERVRGKIDEQFGNDPLV
jgi:hypothetical protein